MAMSTSAFPNGAQGTSGVNVTNLGALDMIVITRNGKTTVITGWRAWLIGVVVFVVATTLLALFAFLALGIALTLTMMVFIAVPVAVGVALIASLFRPRV
jgi:hypothetical protein